MKFFPQVILTISLTFLSCSHNSSFNGYQGHGGSSLSEETIQKYEAKPLSDTMAKRVRSTLEIDSTSSGILTNDGKELFFNWRVTGVDQIWKVQGPLKFPTQMTGGEEASYLLGISPDGKKIYISRDSKGDEYTGIFYQDRNGGEVKEIYRKNKVKALLQLISSDNRTLYFRANENNPKNFSLYKYDLKTKEKEELLTKDGYWFIQEEHKNKDLLVGRMKTNICSEYFILSSKTKKLTPVLGQEGCNNYRIQFGRSNNVFIVRTDKFSDFSQLYAFNLKTKKWKLLVKGDFDVPYFFMDFPKTKIFYGTSKDGYYDVGILNAKTFDKISFPKFKNADHVSFAQVTDNGRYLNFIVESAQSPSINYIYDFNTGRYKQWTLSRTPEVDTSSFVRDTLEYYEAKDGTKIPMFVTAPKSCRKEGLLKPCPVVVKFHGGPESISSPGFSPTNQLFTKEGFILVRPNVRGSRGYGKKWLNADNGPKRLDVITDIQDAATWIKKNWAIKGVSPKVGIMGGSYGGYSTLVGMTLFAGAYDAGVASVGMSSLVTFLQNTADYRRKMRESEYGYLDKDMEALQKLSPINYIERIEAPLMIIHGANDPRVPAGEAVQIMQEMEKRKIDGELILFSDEGHGTRKIKNKVLKVGHTLEFLKKHLKD